MSYDRVLDIETAQAQKAQQLANEASYLPLTPAQPEDSVTTFFWVDNFDRGRKWRVCCQHNNYDGLSRDD